MTMQDFDPGNLMGYKDPPWLLHFQWAGGTTNTVHRYALVEEIHINNIHSRTKQKEDEKGLTQKEIWEKKYKRKESNGL